MKADCLANLPNGIDPPLLAPYDLGQLCQLTQQAPRNGALQIWMERYCKARTLERRVWALDAPPPGYSIPGLTDSAGSSTEDTLPYLGAEPSPPFVDITASDQDPFWVREENSDSECGSPTETHRILTIPEPGEVEGTTTSHGDLFSEVGSGTASIGPEGSIPADGGADSSGSNLSATTLVGDDRNNVDCYFPPNEVGAAGHIIDPTLSGASASADYMPYGVGTVDVAEES